MNSGLSIVVSVDRQRLSVLQADRITRDFAISTAKRGTGFKQGSYRTPTGRFVIREKIGAGMAAGTIFIGRRPVGIWSPGQPGNEDLILTRILRLDGIDPENSNSWDRYIYIHGTNHEELLGTPASMGCVRMANSDVADLFSLVDAGTPVEIIPPTNPQPAIEHDDTPDTVFPHPTGGLTFNKQKQTLCVTNSSEPHYAAAVMAKAKNVNKGKRYTPQEKAQILEFVAEVNSKQKRGGQKAAAEKFGISPLTISNWLKAAGKKATKKPAAKKPAAEKPAAKKPATKKVAKKKAAKRGRPAKKKAGKPGRPAKKKAGKPGRPAKKKAAKRGRPAKKAGAKRGRPAGGGFITKLRKLANLNDEISKMEAGIAKLKAEFATLKDSL